MTTKADWYFDFISPFAYLQFMAFDRLPGDLDITLKPVLFAGLLGHWDMKGPAEIPAKRVQTYRYCHWLAGKRGVPFKTPPAHPFNPLTALRLAIAAGSTREVVGAIFDHVWGQGRDAQTPEALREVGAALGIADVPAATADPAVKQALSDNGTEAVSRGVFGVPTFVIGDELFWGDDATGMMLDYLADPQSFKQGEMARLGSLPEGARRKQSRL